jgi:hypothetical protein
VTVTNCNGCTSTDDVTVYIKNSCKVDAGKDTNICKGDSITLCASGCMGYTWFNGSTQQCITIAPIITLSYNVTGEDTNHCPTSDNVIVTVLNAPNNPVISLSSKGDSLLSSANYGNQWYYNNAILIGDTGQVYIPVIPGNYFSIVTNKCGSDTSNSINISAVGLTEIQEQSGIKIYPNPANIKIIVETPYPIENSISIFNVNGQEVFKQNIVGSQNNKIQININDFSPGVYYLKVMNEKNIAIGKLIKE